MPNTIVHEQNGIYRKFTGLISAEEILESNFMMQSSRDFNTEIYIINDFSDITGHTINPEAISAYAMSDEVISHNKHQLKIALVVTNPSYQPLAECYVQLMQATPFQCQVFNSLDQAREWTNSNEALADISQASGKN